MSYFNPDPIVPKWDALTVHEEIRKTKEEIGRLHYKLHRLENELNWYQRDYCKTYVSDKHTYVSFNNGNDLELIESEDAARSKGWFLGIDLAKEQ